MKIKHLLFAMLLLGVFHACDTASVRPPFFVLASGDVYTELTRNGNGDSIIYRTCFLGEEFFKTKLSSGIAIAPSKAVYPGTFPMDYFSSDSSKMMATTPFLPYDAASMSSNIGIYKFYLVSDTTGERSYTLDSIGSVPADTVIKITYQQSSILTEDIFLEWDPLPTATEYQIVIIDKASSQTIYNYTFPNSGNIDTYEILPTDPGWITSPTRRDYYMVRLYSRTRDARNKITVSTFDQYEMLY